MAHVDALSGLSAFTRLGFVEGLVICAALGGWMYRRQRSGARLGGDRRHQQLAGAGVEVEHAARRVTAVGVPGDAALGVEQQHARAVRPLAARSGR